MYWVGVGSMVALLFLMRFMMQHILDRQTGKENAMESKHHLASALRPILDTLWAIGTAVSATAILPA